MLLKTHLAITLFFVLILLDSVESKLVFAIVAVVATYLPDVDSRYSTLGRKKINRILQWFTKHRGVIHSYTFLLAITLFFALFFPIVALGFFLGYGLHLFADSFTRDGIRPFYPSRAVSKGRLRTGGKTEIGILVTFVILDVMLLFVQISSIF